MEQVEQVKEAARMIRAARRELATTELDPAGELVPTLDAAADAVRAVRELVAGVSERVELLGKHPRLAVESTVTTASGATAAEWLRGDLVVSADHLLSAVAATEQARDAAGRLYLTDTEEER